MLLTRCYSLTHNFSLPRVTGCLRSPDREKTVSRNARKRYVSERACFYIPKGEKPRNFMGLEAKSYSTINNFLLTEHRDKEAALRFLKKAIRRNGLPETITIDGSDANEAAIKSYNEAHGTAIAIRQVKYLNNIVEQDHRAIKRVTRPMLGFKSFAAAQD